MGGVVSRDEIGNLGYELLINETKLELKSNIIPLGKIRLGTFYHRALLFKVLCDKLCIRVSLERGDYNRAWNAVALKEDNVFFFKFQKKFLIFILKINFFQGSLRHYLVDLMFQPGKLMPVNSLDAIQYVKL